jgi:hypothetical protein
LQLTQKDMNPRGVSPQANSPVLRLKSQQQNGETKQNHKIPPPEREIQ